MAYLKGKTVSVELDSQDLVVLLADLEAASGEISNAMTGAPLNVKLILQESLNNRAHLIVVLNKAFNELNK